MTLEQLRMMLAVGRLGSLKLAGEALHKTQPAISQGIKHLEHQVGVVLFSREGYRLALTEAGTQLSQYARRIIEEVERMEQFAGYLATGYEARVTLALEASFDINRILPIFEQAQRDFPNTRIVLRQEYLSGAFEAVQQARADLAISPVSDALMAFGGLESKFVHESALVTVVAPRLLERHPHLRDKLELINEYQILVQDSGTATANHDMGTADGQRRWYVNDFATKRALILSGMGWGKLPLYLIQEDLHNGSLCKVLSETPGSQLNVRYFALRRTAQVPGPVATALWEMLAGL